MKATLKTLGLTIHWMPGWALGDLAVLGTGWVWSAQVSWQVCKLDVLGPYCDEHRKACLEICSSLRCWLCLQA